MGEASEEKRSCSDRSIKHGGSLLRYWKHWNHFFIGTFFMNRPPGPLEDNRIKRKDVIGGVSGVALLLSFTYSAQVEQFATNPRVSGSIPGSFLA